MRKITKMKAKRSIGFYVGLLVFALMVATACIYPSISEDLYNAEVVLYCAIGAVVFLATSLLRKTSDLAPIGLMICSLLAIGAFASTSGMIDYLSTQFFGGFSLEVIFALPLPVWFTMVSLVLSWALSSVAMYMAQHKYVEQK